LDTTTKREGRMRHLIVRARRGTVNQFPSGIEANGGHSPR